MGVRTKSFAVVLASAVIVATPAAAASEPSGLHEALEQLAREGQFSGAVVVRGAEGVRFARGYGFADPFTGRLFTPDTPADSGSIAKPITAAAVLLLEREGKVDLEAPVRKYLPEYPDSKTAVRHLLAHSAGFGIEESAEAMAGKTNAALLAEAANGERLFQPGMAFAYCNLCYSTLAMLIERVSGIHYLDFVQRRVLLPDGVTLRPERLADWKGRAIGYRRSSSGQVERFDSWEGEAFYGGANFSLSAAHLAQWGSEWWKPGLAAIRAKAAAPAVVARNPSGLTWGNWYCAPRALRCHYLGHHEGFHHMLYWDADRQVSVAMVSNNTLAPAVQQRLQRAIIAFVNGDPGKARSELQSPFTGQDVSAGKFDLSSGETVEIATDGEPKSVRRGGIDYAAYPIDSNIRYVPGLDVYVTRNTDGRLRWLSLYEDLTGSPAD